MHDSDEMRWVKDSEMPECPVEMREFVARERAAMLVPVRGDVDMIMGGPPCQGVRGLPPRSALLAPPPRC